MNGNLKASLQTVAKYLGAIFVFILLLSVVLTDLEKQGGGYLEWVFMHIYSYALASIEEVREIADTPLASLTIGKIFTLALYFYFSWLLIYIASGIWSVYRECSEEREETKREERMEKLREEREQQRLRDEEEAKYSEDAQRKCAECVSAMESTESVSDLETLYQEAVSSWPRWEKSLTRVYKKKKKSI